MSRMALPASRAIRMTPSSNIVRFIQRAPRSFVLFVAIAREVNSRTNPEILRPNPICARPARMKRCTALTHLQRLGAESLHIMREVVAEAERPVTLYSMGKDSSVMLHLARKAFYPAKPPFSLLHVDTTWKFRAMYAMRERV